MNKTTVLFTSIFLVLLSMNSLAFGGTLAKNLFPHLGATGTTALRLIVAALILIPIERPWMFRFSKKSLQWIFAYGAALACMNTFFYLSIERIPLGIAIAIEFLGPLGLAIITSKNKVDYIWAAVAAVGVYLLLPASSSAHALDPLGIVYALVAAVMWALYILLGKKVGSLGSAGAVTSYGLLFAGLIMVPLALSTPAVLIDNPKLIWFVLSVGLFSSAIPYSLEMRALQNIPSQTFGILMSLEPAVGAMFGFFLLAEYLVWQQLLAMGLIMIASVGTVLSASRRAPVAQVATPV